MFPRVSVYYDNVDTCNISECRHEMIGIVDDKVCQATSGHGVFTKNTTSFIRSDDLIMLPNEMGLLGIISVLGITDADKAEARDVTWF